MDFLAFAPILLYIPLFAAISCLAVYHLIYSRHVAQWKRSNIPYLQPSFLIGHEYFLSLYKYSSLVSFDRVYRENSDNDVVGFFIGTMPVVMIRSPALIKQIFAKNFDKTFKPGLSASKKDAISQNMPGLCGDMHLWKSTRSTLSPMYSAARIGGKQFTKIKTQMERLWAHTEEAYLNGRPIDAKQVSFNFAEDATSHIFFGLDANSYEEKGEVFRLVTSLSEPSLRRMLSLYVEMQLPGTKMIDLLKFLNQENTGMMSSLIKKQIEFKNRHTSNENDFVDFLMTFRNEEETSTQNAETEITDQMIGFGMSIILGMDSLAMLASFAIHLLSLHPKHQKKIRKEVIEVMHKHKTSEFTNEVVQDLVFTDQCLLETARLYPSIPVISRVCSEDFTIAGTDFTFKKGERIIMNPYSIHRDPKHFKNPDEFIPERFSPEKRREISQDNILILGNGPRKCPGGKLGFLMVASLIASLLHKYEIKPRSHVKQMNATDFHPRGFTNIHREEYLWMYFHARLWPRNQSTLQGK